MIRSIRRNIIRRQLGRGMWHRHSSYHIHSPVYRGKPHVYGYCKMCGCALKRYPQPQGETT